MNVLRFAFVPTASTPLGLPSFRQHFYTISHDPSKTTVSGIDITFKYGSASKNEAKSTPMYKVLEKNERDDSLLPLKIKSKPLGSHPLHQKRQQKIHQILEKIEGVSSAYGLCLTVEVKFLGSNVPQKIVYHLLAGFGSDAVIKSKWDVQLEQEETSTGEDKKFCFKGNLNLPLSSVYDVNKILEEENKFKFDTKLAMGKTCDEMTVKINGYTKTSEEQKKKVEKSSLMKEYKRLVEKRVALTKVSEIAQKLRAEASSLDEVEFDIVYNNIPEPVVDVAHKLEKFAQVWYLPYLYKGNELKRSEVSRDSILERMTKNILGHPKERREVLEAETPLSLLDVSGKAKVRINFNPIHKTMTVRLASSHENLVTFYEIPVPFPLGYYFPLTSSQTSSESSYKSETKMEPICKVEDNEVSTFDNKTFPLKLTDCFHLLSTNCGGINEIFKWQVLIAKSKDMPERKVIKTIIKSIPIIFFPEKYETKIKVKDHFITLTPGQKYPIMGLESGLEGRSNTIAKIIRYKDNTFVITSTFFTLKYHNNGEIIEIFSSIFEKSKLCGMCGNFNKDKSDDMLSPKMCLLSKPEVFTASYAVPGIKGREREGEEENEKRSERSCVSEQIRRELVKEQEENCIRVNPAIGISSARSKSSTLSGIRGKIGSEGLYQSSSSENREREEEERFSRTSVTSQRSKESWLESRSVSSCYRPVHHVLFKGGKTCFSVRPSIECASKCRRIGERQEEASFHCMRSSSPEAERLLKRVERGEIVSELEHASKETIRNIIVPKSCSAKN